MMAWVESLSAHWAWLILAAALATAEVLIPGFFLIWFALAAFITGLITLLLPVPVAVQLVLFALAAVASLVRRMVSPRFCFSASARCPSAHACAVFCSAFASA